MSEGQHNIIKLMLEIRITEEEATQVREDLANAISFVERSSRTYGDSSEANVKAKETGEIRVRAAYLRLHPETTSGK